MSRHTVIETVWGAESLASNQPSRASLVRSLFGARVASSSTKASPRSQLCARLGPGGYCRRPGNQGTQTCLSAGRDALLQAAWYGPAGRPAVQDPREGAKPREENNVKTSSGAASARRSGGAENPRPSLPQEGAVKSAVMHRASGCQRSPVAQLPFRCKGDSAAAGSRGAG